MKRVAAALLVVMLAGIATKCVPASPDAATYDEQARLTLGTAVSEVRTVRTILQTLYDDRMLRPTAIAQMRYSETSLDTATSGFVQLNPPRERDRMTRRLTTLLGDAGDLLATARIAIERSDRSRYPGLISELDTTATTLEELEERVS